MVLSQTETSGSDFDTEFPEHSEAAENVAAEGHRALRDVLSKYGYPPEDPDVHPLITDLEHAYTQDLEQVCVDLSDRNNAAGFKVLVLVGNDWRRNGSEYSGMLGITEDGRLVTICFRNSDQKRAALTNPMETLKPGLAISRLYFDISKDINSDSPLKSVNSCIDFHKSQYRPGKQMKDELKQVLRKCMDRRLQMMVNQIENALDPDLLCIMKEYENTSTDKIRWLTGGDGVHSDIVQARQQAIRAYPVMAGKFNWSQSFLKAIDNRTSLKTAMAQHYNVDESRIKRLSANRMKIYPGTIIERHIQEILDLPDGTVPKTEAEFRDLSLFTEFGRNVYHESLVETMWRLSEHGNPLRLTDRLKQTSGRNISDAVDFLARKLFVPACLNRTRILFCGPGSMIKSDDTENREHDGMEDDGMEDEDKSSIHSLARNEILSSFSASELLDLSERYHRNIMRYEDRLNIISVNYDWPGMFGTLDLGNGYTARELTSAKQLKIQGLAENHCVGGYALRVLEGDMHQKAVTIIFSIEKDGKCYSTAEIECERDFNNTLHGQVIQNQARSNTDPSEDTEFAANCIEEHISKANPEIFSEYCEGLRLARQEMNLVPGFSEEIMACGFDPYNRTHFDIVWEELRSVLPRHMRRNGPDEFIENAEFNRKFIAVPEKLGKFRLSKNPDTAESVNNIEIDDNDKNSGPGY